MRRILAVLLVMALASPAAADPLHDRVASIGAQLDARRPMGQALERTVARHMSSLRDLTKRAKLAGMNLPPVVVKGGHVGQLKPRLGFGSPYILKEMRVALMISPDSVATRVETREGDGAQKWETSNDQPMKMQKLPRFRADRAVVRMLVDSGVSAEAFDAAFDRWSQMISYALTPSPVEGAIEVTMKNVTPTPPPALAAPASSTAP
jgi:hypothetical protein